MWHTFRIWAWILPVIACGCSTNSEEELYPQKSLCDTTAITYSKVIQPIMQSKCISCHGTGAPTAGIDLEGYENVKGYALDSTLLEVMRYNGEIKMPPEGKVSDCDLEKIQLWIKAGAPNN